MSINPHPATLDQLDHLVPKEYLKGAKASLHGHSFLKEFDFSPRKWRYLVRMAAELKEESKAGIRPLRLAGKNIALIFEKTSTRTRSAFEVAAHQEGGSTTYLDPASSQLGHKESVADTARVLGRMFDAIEYRGFGQSRVEELARYAGVPVYNGLTDEWHPTQMLADQLTMLEHSESRLGDLKLAYLGDGRSNVANSIIAASALVGMDVRMVAPAELQPNPALVEYANTVAGNTGAKITVTDSLDAVKGADFLYTDVWVSMGEPKSVWQERIRLLKPYQINASVVERTGNPDVKVLHCLPAYHDLNTGIARELHEATGGDNGGMTEFEITDEVFEANAQVIFDEAENRMHTIKAVMVSTLYK
jgi:ornithine carbamoyltransferase